MSTSLKNKIILYSLLSVVIPIFTSIYLIYSSTEESKKRIYLLNKSRIEHIKNDTLNLLVNADQICDQITKSRELADYLHAPIEGRKHIENILYARFLSLQKSSQIIDGFKVLDKNFEPLFIFGKDYTSHMENGQDSFFVENETIFIKRSIYYDDQYINFNGSNLFGYILASIPESKVKLHVPGLKNIQTISSLNLEGMSIGVYDEIIQDQNVLYALFFLLIFLITSVLSGIYLIHSSIFLPLRKITEYVKDRAQIIIEHKDKNELNILMETFKTYCETFERQTQLVVIAKATQMIAHDIKKPFISISILLKLMESTNDQNDLKNIVDRYSHQIKIILSKVDNLLRDILDSGRDFTIKKTEIDIASIAKRSVDSVLLFNTNNKISFTYDISHTLPVFGDEGKLGRVFENILSNAIEAAKIRNSEIWINSKNLLVNNKEFIQICIGNSGEIISENDIDHIFEPFFSRKKNGGIGLGLSICKKIILLHGGRIWCESTSNTGTIFYIELPSDSVKI